jgi:RNA polymerase sigma-54 factor
MKQVLRQQLQQKLTPQQILLMKLIQLPTQELEMRLKREIEENPVLEEPIISTSSDEVDSQENTDDTEDLDSTELELMRTDDYDYPAPQSASTERDTFYSLTETTSLRQDLVEQISMKISDEEEMIIATYLIGSLDDSGYLRRDTGSIVDDLAFTQGIESSEEKVEEVLEALQQLDPAGIGARDLQECLLLQLKRKDSHDLIVRNAQYIIEFMFDDFSHRRLEKIIDKTGISEEDLKDVMTEIQDLNPKPGETSSDVGERSIAVMPDFSIGVADDEISVSLTNSSVPELHINKSYLDMLESYDKKKDKTKKETVSFIRQKVDSANWFIEALKQREETLLKTMRTIAVFQRKYFLSGDNKDLRPMILKDIAETIDMDISTVSRVVNSKYVQTPYGIFKLKKFFSESFTKESGEEVSTNEVKQLLKTLIEKEDSTNPLKDDQLTTMLVEQGYPLARRTVAKYREQLGFPVARLRRNI